MSDDATPVFEPGDVVFGEDPYKGEEAARPWLVVSNHEGRPFHGDQYIVLTLTTRTWMEGLIEVDDDAWIRGGTPDDSRIAPWGVQSVGPGDIDYWQGRIDDATVVAAVDALVDCLRE